MIAEHRAAHGSEWVTIRSIVEKIGCSVPSTII